MALHVFAIPQGKSELDHDERLCVDTERAACFVFHVDPVQLFDGHWACACCGATTRPRAAGEA